MQNGKLFWGFLLISLGVIYLLTKASIVTSGFGFVWDIWPVFFIFWGALVLLKETFVRPFAAAGLGILAGLLIYGFAFRATHSICDFETDFPGIGTISTFEENYEGNIKSVKLKLEGGLGKLKINGETDKLFSARGVILGSNFNYESDDRDSTAQVRIDMDTNLRFKVFGKQVSPKLELNLNQNPDWQLKFELGAVQGKIDLSENKVSKLSLDAGAAEIDLKLGNKQLNSDVRIDLGASDLVVRIPMDSGCRVSGSVFMVDRELDGFIRDEDDNFITPDYATAKNKINLEINGGVSKLTIDRY